VTRTQGNNRAIKDGRVKPRDFDFAFEEVPVLVKGFRRMVRELAYDICEMALTTYICARDNGVRFTALPIFLVRDFHHGAIQVAAEGGVSSAKDLEGRRVGVSRGYTVTTGVWARAILREEMGLDLSKVTWSLSGDEHVEAYRPPANVEPLPKDMDLEGALLNGHLAAAIGPTMDVPGIRTLYPDPFAAAVAAMTDRGLYPINHLVVVRDELLEQNPEIAVQVFEAFAESKRLYVEDLKAGRIAEPTAIDRVHLAALAVMDDPLPYGVDPNRAVLERLVQEAVDQKIIGAPVAVDDLFAAPTRSLTA
jgi:4,5-dihydroxyphthalate decarboxylase